MKNLNEENMLVQVFKRVFDLLGRISLIYAIYILLTKMFTGPYLIFLFKVIGSIVAGLVVVYYSYTIFEIVGKFCKLKKSYFKEFLDKKVTIGYEVGSFWDVVDRYKDEDDLAIVVGVNNRFCLDQDYLSKNSLISDYMRKLSDTEKEVLNQDIKSKMYGDIIGYDEMKKPIYRNGALYVSHPTENIHFETALLAMCEPSYINGSGKFTSTREGLIESFEILFEQMPNIFTNSTLIIPLIGTKSSGSPLSQEEVAKFLISAFANYSRIKQHRQARRLVISLYDKDFEKMEDLLKIKKHIDMECEMGAFSYSKIKSEIEGTYSLYKEKVGV